MISAVLSSEDLSEECYSSIRHGGMTKKKKKKTLKGCFLLKSLEDLRGKKTTVCGVQYQTFRVKFRYVRESKSNI